MYRLGVSALSMCASDFWAVMHRISWFQALQGVGIFAGCFRTLRSCRSCVGVLQYVLHMCTVHVLAALYRCLPLASRMDWANESVRAQQMVASGEVVLHEEQHMQLLPKHSGSGELETADAAAADFTLLQDVDCVTVVHDRHFHLYRRLYRCDWK